MDGGGGRKVKEGERGTDSEDSTRIKHHEMRMARDRDHSGEKKRVQN